MKKIIITAEDGYQLSALLGQPAGDNAGTVILSSATGVKKEFYINFAKFLTLKKYTVLLYDYRGIGESAPENLKNSTAYMHEWGTKDMNAVLDFMVEEKGLSDIIWLGHSIGAQLTGFITKREHLKKVIAVNAALGYWGYFPFPMKMMVWTLWYIISPVLVKIYGYGTMKKVGWGENLPKNAFLEFRKWCMSKNYYGSYIQERLKKDKFYSFITPITAVYTSDDPIANDKTVPLMMEFFPHAEVDIIKIPVADYTNEKVGHTGLFRKKFEKELWPVLVKVIEKETEPVEVLV